VKSPKRELISRVQTRIPVINEIEPAIFQRAAVGFNLAKSERVKRASVLGCDLHNYLVLTGSFFHRDYLCRKRGHLGLIFYRSGRLRVETTFCESILGPNVEQYFNASLREHRPTFFTKTTNMMNVRVDITIGLPRKQRLI
jgi:hypothetical protein